MEKTHIGSLMQTTLENIRDMVDVGTVIGEAVEVSPGVSVIPVSRVCLGFVSGGGEYEGEDTKLKDVPEGRALPFAGGSGAGVSVQPVGFLVVGPEGVRMLPAQNVTMLERALNCLPELIEDVKAMFPSHEEQGCSCGCGENEDKDVPEE